MAKTGKHVMLSYQWDHQNLVEKVYDGLASVGIPAWMDIKGGMKTNVNDSMAYGVDNAAVICCFLSPEYQDSKNCKKELNYAEQCDVTIVPVMTIRDWKPREWLGLITAGLLWIDFRETNNLEIRIESLAKEIVHRAGSKITLSKGERPKTAGKSQKTLDLEKKPGRAFRHKQTGQFLAESGEVKFQTASGHRSSIVLRNQAEPTSYWMEEQQKKGSEIYFYKNYQTNGYLGYDPNGDYIYTKAQHYGAEEWLLIADDSSTSGERSVVIYANYGEKYLAIRNGKLTGVSDRAPDCVWILG